MKHLKKRLQTLVFTVLAFTLSHPAMAVDNLLDDLGLGGQDDILEVGNERYVFVVDSMRRSS